MGSVDEPLRHNSKTTILLYGFDREMVYSDGSTVNQKKKRDASKMTYADTLAFITDKEGSPNPDDKIEGYVDMAGYCKWLANNLYFKGMDICK